MTGEDAASMLARQGAKGIRKPVEFRHGPATVNGERARRKPPGPGGVGKVRGSEDPEVRRLAVARERSNPSGAWTPRRRLFC